MTQRSKKASQAVVEEDGKTVDQTIVVSMEIRSPKVEASSEDARAMVVTGSMPLLGLELSVIDNKRKNPIVSTYFDLSNSLFPVCSPLLGTSIFQNTVIVGKSSLRRSQNSVCYTTLLHNHHQPSDQTPQQTVDNDQINCESYLRK